MNKPLPPPADEDFRATFGGQGQYSTDSVEIPTDAADFSEYPEDTNELIGRIPDRTPSELRAMQRAMLALSLDENVRASERAQCVRAYRDIEIVRRAIRGKPLALNPSMRIDAPSSRSQSPSIMPDAFSRAA